MRSVRAVWAMILLVTLTLGVGCARQRFKTDAHFDTTYDFASVQSFAFSPRREKVKTSEGGRILEQAVREQLLERSYREAPAEGADVLISYDIGVYARAKLSSSSAFAQTQGGLTVQVFDRKTDRSVWYGWSEAIVREDDDREEVIRAATAALFDDQIPTAD